MTRTGARGVPPSLGSVEQLLTGLGVALAGRYALNEKLAVLENLEGAERG